MILAPSDIQGGLDTPSHQGRHRVLWRRMNGAPTKSGDTAPIPATGATMLSVSLGRGTVRAEHVAATGRRTWL
jgi:hypothetical protein